MPLCAGAVVDPACFALLHTGPYAVLTKDTMPQTYKRKRSWSRAVFSNLQRKGLEKRFEIQKYVTKPDRKQLAAMLGLTDAQVSHDTAHLENNQKNHVVLSLSVSICPLAFLGASALIIAKSQGYCKMRTTLQDGEVAAHTPCKCLYVSPLTLQEMYCVIMRPGEMKVHYTKSYQTQ